MKRAIAAAAVLVVTACDRTATTERAAATPSVSAATTTAPATPAPLSPQKPRATFDGFPGWLGLAAIDGAGGDVDAPANPAAHIALTEPAAWAALGGTRQLALAPGYKEEVGYFSTAEIPFGCDGRKETFAFFKGKTRPPRGIVWLTDFGNVSVTATEPATVSAAVKAAGPSELRAWRIGTRTFVTRRSDKAITAEIWDGETRVWKEESPWTPMQGGDDVPPSLEGGPAIPIPRLVLHADDESLLVVQSDGFEGTNFRGIHLEKGSARRAEGGLYLYWCAF